MMTTSTALKCKGNECFKQLQYDQALQWYTRALCSCADEPEADQAEQTVSILRNRSLCNFKLANFVDAGKDARDACMMSKDARSDSKSLFRLAQACMGVQLHAECREVCLAALKHSPEDTAAANDLRALLLSATTASGKPHDNGPPSLEVAELQGSVHEMLQTLKFATSASPNLSAELQRSGDSSATAGSCAAAAIPPVSETPDEVQRKLGNEEYKRGNYGCALAHYSEALTLNSGNAAALGNRCAAALMLRQYSNARADAQAALLAEPENTRTMLRLSKASLGCGDVPAAVRAARDAVMQDPGAAGPRGELAKLEHLQRELAASAAAAEAGNGQAALHAALRAARILPDLAAGVVSITLARAQLLAGRHSEGLTTSRTAVRETENSSEAMHVHADALLATGNVARAATMYQMLYTRDPDNVSIGKLLKRAKVMQAGKELGNAAFKAGRFQDAYDQYTRSLGAATGLHNNFVAQVATNRASACLRLSRPRDAISDADHAASADDSFAKAYFRRAQAHEALQEWEDAVRHYERAIKIDKDFPGISQALRNAKAELKKSKRVDYYKLLDIDKSAGVHDIKKAFKRTALKCHPDKVPLHERAEAEQKFKLVGEANAILTDAQKRRRYDAGWSAEEIANGYQEGQGHGGGMRGAQGEGMEDVLFEMFMNQRGGFKF